MQWSLHTPFAFSCFIPAKIYKFTTPLPYSMAPLFKVVVMIFLFILCFSFFTIVKGQALWCVARSDASDQALQTALDYACGAGADCAPILPNGLCYLPNTLQAHASYAFNSYYQRKNMAPGSCNFAGTATVAKTDPSYGSCDYPSSPSTAGGSLTPGGTSGGTTGGTNPITTPTLNVPPPTGTTPIYGNGGLIPGMGSGVPSTPNSKASLKFSITTPLSLASFLLVLSCIS